MSKRSHDSVSASDHRSSATLCSRCRDTGDHNGHISKSVAIESSATTMMQCSLPPHTTSVEFPSLEAFETHHTKEHTNRCTSCGKNFPSAHFLALHLDEAHNPLREVLASKGEKTYSCFVEGCERKCSHPSKRRLHLIDKHGFPKVYNFRIVETGIDKTASLLREGQKRRVSVSVDQQTRHHRRPSGVNRSYPDDKAQLTSSPDEVAEHSSSITSQPLVGPGQEDRKIIRPDDSIDELETSLSALTFVPRSVRSRQVQKSSQLRNA